MSTNKGDPDLFKKVITGDADFFLFTKLKAPLRGKRFSAIEEMKKKFKPRFKSVSRIGNKRWHTCIICEGDYFKEEMINKYILLEKN